MTDNQLIQTIGRPAAITPDMYMTVDEMRQQGKSLREIGNELGVTKQAVSTYLQRCGSAVVPKGPIAAYSGAFDNNAKREQEVRIKANERVLKLFKRAYPGITFKGRHAPEPEGFTPPSEVTKSAHKQASEAALKAKCDDLVQGICARRGVSFDRVMGGSLKHPAVLARHEAFHALRDNLDMSAAAIGRYFGKHHGAVLRVLKRDREPCEEAV